MLISPRLAIIFYEHNSPGIVKQLVLFENEERLSEFNRLSVFNENLFDYAGFFRLDFIHDLHCLNNADSGIRINFRADFTKASEPGAEDR